MLSDVLIVIDMQNDVLCENGQKIWKRDELIKRINQRIAAYRAQQLPIIFVQHNDPWLKQYSKAWELVTELDVRESDIFVDKTHPNSFYRTNLLEHLTKLSAEKLEFCGAQTQYCVNTTIVFAHGLGFDNFMMHGAASTYDSSQMTAEATNQFYEQLWNGRFLSFLDESKL